MRYREAQDSCLVWVGMSKDEDRDEWTLDWFKANFREFKNDFKGEFQYLVDTLKGVGIRMVCACVSIMLRHTTSTRHTKLALMAVPMDAAEEAFTRAQLDTKPIEEQKALAKRYEIAPDELVYYFTLKRLVAMYEKLGLKVDYMDAYHANMQGTLGNVLDACKRQAYFGRLRGSGPAAHTRHFLNSRKPAAKPTL